MKKFVAFAVILLSSALAAYVMLSKPKLANQASTPAAVADKKLKLWDLPKLSSPAADPKAEHAEAACQSKLSALIDQLSVIDSSPAGATLQPWSSESCPDTQACQSLLDAYEQHCRQTWNQESCKITLTLLKARLGSELLGPIDPNQIEELPIIFTKLLAYDWQNPGAILPYIHRGLELDGQNQILLTAKYAVTAMDFLQHKDRLQQKWTELDTYFHEIMDPKLVTDDRIIELHMVLLIKRETNLDEVLTFLETWRDAFRHPSVFKYLKSAVLYKQKKAAEAIALLKECKAENPAEIRCQETLDLVSAMPSGQFHESAYRVRLDVMPIFMEHME